MQGGVTDEIKSTMPWQYIIHPNGFIQAFDNANREVSIIHILEVACAASRAIATNKG